MPRNTYGYMKYIRYRVAEKVPDHFPFKLQSKCYDFASIWSLLDRRNIGLTLKYVPYRFLSDLHD